MSDIIRDFGSHGPYIIAAYGVVIVAMVGLAVQSYGARRQWRRRLDAARTPRREA